MGLVDDVLFLSNFSMYILCDVLYVPTYLFITITGSYNGQIMDVTTYYIFCFDTNNYGSHKGLSFLLVPCYSARATKLVLTETSSAFVKLSLVPNTYEN